MDTLGILDLVIGLFFIYFVFSVITTVIVEIYTQATNLRHEILRKWADQLINTNDSIMQHSLIKNLVGEGRKADYIPSDIFSSALLDLINGGQTIENDSHTNYSIIKEKLEAKTDCVIGDPTFRQYLLNDWTEASNMPQTMVSIKGRIERYFDHAMLRLNGTYKKYTKKASFITAFALALIVNVDTIELAKYLKEHPEQRSELAMRAASINTDTVIMKIYSDISFLDTVTSKDSADAEEIIASMQHSLDNLQAGLQYASELKSPGLPLGWSTIPDGCWLVWLNKVLGIILTALALTLGAPFWYDMINKLVDIRGTGHRPVPLGASGSKKPAG